MSGSIRVVVVDLRELVNRFVLTAVAVAVAVGVVAAAAGIERPIRAAALVLTVLLAVRLGIVRHRGERRRVRPATCRRICTTVRGHEECIDMRRYLARRPRRALPGVPAPALEDSDTGRFGTALGGAPRPSGSMVGWKAR